MSRTQLSSSSFSCIKTGFSITFIFFHFRIKLYIGRVNVHTGSQHAGEIMYSASVAVANQLFDKVTWHNDIALLLLKSELRLKSKCNIFTIGY